MRTCTVEFSGGGDASGSKRMRAICVAGRSRVNSCCCVPAYTPETGRICAIFPGTRRLPNSTKTSCPTGIGETCRDYSGDRRKDAALAEMALHLIETTSKLLDELIKRGKL